MSAEQRARAAGRARITQVTVAGDYYAAPVPGAGPTSAPGLPAPPAALVGRDGSVKVLTDLLGEGEGEGGGRAPVTVVAGLPGVGKSALAVATAHRAVEYGWFEERVFFLQLHGYAPSGAVSGAQAVREMLRCLGVGDADVPPSPDGQVALYRARLASLARAGQRVLIVADDAGAVSQVQDLVPPDGTHRLLVTSRHRLVAPGFTARVVGLDELAVEPAAELIAGALLRTWPEDPRPAREPEALARVADLCGRLPLALTVAGALLAGDPGLAVGELARQLAESRSRLEKLHVDGDVPVGVRAAFDLSYARLPVDQARLFRLLSLVPGPDCSTALACVLVQNEGAITVEGRAALRPSLAAMAAASLLSEQPVGSGRWRMHDLVRLYAQGRAEECALEDGREEILDRLLGAILLNTEMATRSLGTAFWETDGEKSPSIAAALNWLETERAVLVAAVGWAAEIGRPEAAFQLSDELGPYLLLYGYAPDGVIVARRTLDVARAQGDRSQVGIALNNLGSALNDVWQTEEAIGSMTEGLLLFRELAHRGGEADSLDLLASAFRRAGRLEEARTSSEEALSLYRELKNRRGEGLALMHLARALNELGELGEAVEVCGQAVNCMREVGDLQREVAVLHLLAELLRGAGQTEESRVVRESVIVMLRGLGRKRAAAHALAGLAKGQLEDGELSDARTGYERALALFVDTGDLHGEGAMLGALGAIDLREGRFEDALASFGRVDALPPGADDRSHAAKTAVGLGFALEGLRRPAESAEAFERAAALFGALGDPEKEEATRAKAVRLRRIPEMAATTATPPVTPRRRWWDRLRPRRRR